MIVGADPDKGLHCDLEKLERCKSLIDFKWRTSSGSHLVIGVKSLLCLANDAA